MLTRLAIAIGIAGFTTVLASYGILKRELNQGYLATNPASFILTVDRVDAALLKAIAANPRVRAVEARRILHGRIEIAPAEWRNSVLFVIQDFSRIRVNKLLPEGGAWPPAPGELLLERDAFQVARAHIGSTLRVRTAGGVERSLRVSGQVHDVGQAQARMENLVYAYIGLDTLPLLGEEPYLNRLHVIANGDTNAAVAEVAKLVKVRRTEIPPPGKHPHAELMGLLLLAMSGFGFAVLALSGFLVVNLITARMATQVRHIALMKAIGGTRLQIARIYLSQAFWLGASALLPGIAVGVWGSWMLCRYLAVFLNFDIASFIAPAWVYLLVAVVGLLVPLAAAAPPVWSGTAIVVPPVFGVSAFDRRLAGIGGLARPVLLSIRNSFRQRTRLGLTVLTLAAAGLFYMSALNVRASMIHTLDRSFAARRFDLLVNLGPSYSVEQVEVVARSIPGVTFAKGAHGEMLQVALSNPTPVELSRVRTVLDAKLAELGIRPRSSTTKAEMRFAFDEHMSMIYIFLIIVSAILAGVGGLGLATTMSLNVLERRCEMGVMRAIGATPGSIAWIVAGEGLFIAVLSWAVAAVTAWPAIHAVPRVDPVFELRGVFLWLVLSLVLGIGASLIPARRAARLPVREALAAE